MKAKRSLQNQEAFIMNFYGELGCLSDANISMEELNSVILECEAMLERAINRADKEEISYWRKMIQINKVQRRELLST